MMAISGRWQTPTSVCSLVRIITLVDSSLYTQKSRHPVILRITTSVYLKYVQLIKVLVWIPVKVMFLHNRSSLLPWSYVCGRGCGVMCFGELMSCGIVDLRWLAAIRWWPSLAKTYKRKMLQIEDVRFGTLKISMLWILIENYYERLYIVYKFTNSIKYPELLKLPEHEIVLESSIYRNNMEFTFIYALILFIGICVTDAER